MTMALSSDTNDLNLKNVAEEIRDDLLDLPEVSQVNIEYIRPLEISIEVSEFTLRQYGLTLDQISRAISRASLDLPGGTIRTESGEILLRTKGQVYQGSEYEDIVVASILTGRNSALARLRRSR